MTRTRPVTPESIDIITPCGQCGGPAFHYPDGLVEAFTDECYDVELDRLRAAISAATTAWAGYASVGDGHTWRTLFAAMRALIDEEQRWSATI